MPAAMAAAAAASEADALKTALMLLRRTNPSEVQHFAEALDVLLERDVADDFLQRVDMPLVVVHDPEAGKDFLATEFNADGDAYR